MMLRGILLHLLIAAVMFTAAYGIALIRQFLPKDLPHKLLQEIATMSSLLASKGASLFRSAAVVRLTRLFLMSGVLLSLSAATAHAHFLWTVLVSGDNGQAQAYLWFSEGARPGEAYLLDRLPSADARLVLADGSTSAPKWTKKEQGDEGGLVAEVQAGPGAELRASWLYGIFARGDEPRLLWYYARYQQGLESAAPASAEAEQLPLYVEVVKQGDSRALRVTWKGQPATGDEVVIEGPDGETTDAITDDAGLVALNASAPGMYSIRARHIEESAGEHEGTKYATVLHYSTLALRVTE